MFFQGVLLILLLAFQDLSTSAACGGSINAIRGIWYDITSPNYPYDYPSSECTWHINKDAADASCLLLIYIYTFNIDPLDDLVVAGKSYSGGSLSEGTYLYIFGGLSISLRFTSKASSGYTGFRIRIVVAYCTHSCTSLAHCPSCANNNPGECLDVDECELGTDDCPASRTCTNTFGSYNCTCPTGYQGALCEEVLYDIEIREDPYGKILATELSDDDYGTCLNLEHPSMMNWVVMKIDMTVWPAEGNKTFYTEIRHGNVPKDYKKWLAVYITIAGVQRKYIEPREVGTTVLKVCPYDATHSDGVTTTMLQCTCEQECSVIFYFKLDFVKSIRVCEIKILRELGN